MRPADPYWFALSFGLSLAVGVGARVLLGYSVADLGHPGALLAGLFAGLVAGMAAGVIAGGAAALRRVVGAAVRGPLRLDRRRAARPPGSAPPALGLLAYPT
jgi:hypothetical protein